MASSDAQCAYLVDVELDDKMNDDLSAMHPVASSFGPRGSSCMHQYMPSAYDHVRDEHDRLLFPRWVLFINPPVHRRISTSAHSDGGGYFVTVHMVAPCSNPNAQNRIGTCTREQAGLDIDAITYSREMQKKFDINATGGSELSTSRWQSDHHLSPSAKSVHGIEYPTVSTLRPNGFILMPPGLIHHFQKELANPGKFINNMRGVENDGALSGDELLPLVGVAGTDVLLGSTEEDVAMHIGVYQKHAALMAASNRAMRSARAPSSPRVDLELWFILVCTGAWRRGLVLGPVQFIQLRAASKAIEIVIAEEVRRHKRIIDLYKAKNRTVLKASTCYRHDAALQLAPPLPPTSASAPTPVDSKAAREVRSTGIHLHCSCRRCGAHIFHHFYIYSDDKDQRWCGECVIACPSASELFEHGHRFTTEGKDLSALIAATRGKYGY